MCPGVSGRLGGPAGLFPHRQQPPAETGASLPVAGDRNDVRSTRQRAQLMNAGLEARAAMPTMRLLGRRALSLGAANAFDYAFQFLLPVVLVRCLDTVAFGQYRLLWLAVGTVMAVVTMALAGRIYNFLNWREDAAQRLYIIK